MFKRLLFRGNTSNNKASPLIKKINGMENIRKGRK